MWPLGGLVIVAGGLLPSLIIWMSEPIRRAAPLTPPEVWQAALRYNGADAVFAASALAFLSVAVRYGYARATPAQPSTRSSSSSSRSSSAKAAAAAAAAGPAPYPGAWVEADGHQAYPRGFPTYLAAAFVISVVTPAALLLGCLAAKGWASELTRALAAATLGPYVLVFAPQIALETRLLSRSFVTPVIPLLFAHYRIWQFVRGLALVAAVAAASGPPLLPHGDSHSSRGGTGVAAALRRQHWLATYLLTLLCFWVFDTACTLVWLPGMFEWQLQDAKLLTRLAKQRQQQHEQQVHQPPPEDSPAAAVKARRRARVSGVGARGGDQWGSGENIDSFGFGT